MNSLTQQYEASRKEMKKEGLPVDALERLASLLLRVDEKQKDVSFAEFHNLAGRFPYCGDSDFGALVLEREADLNGSGPTKTRMYREAMWRARWCATGATAGGEGYARMMDVERLMEKSKEAEQDGAGQRR
jgi:hypothetical protein